MNRDKFIQEIVANKNQLYAVAFSILRNHEDAEDIIQTALLLAFEKMDTLKDDEKFKPWLMRIVVNEAKMYIRHNSRVFCMENVDELISKFVDDEQRELWRLVLTLKSEFSTVLILYYAQGYAVREISQILRIPQGTVKSRLSKARQLLKEELEGNDESVNG